MAVLHLLDSVATLQPLSIERLNLIEPEYTLLQGLPSGQVGTVVRIYDGDSPHYLVEFADLQGREYAMAVLQAHEVLALHYEVSVAN
ncbi:DUF4926 domain-containing protein [Pantanalinema rosaneae CENA516]|uniref:DUF4926 domain-containing protein n=1 Tax=Pantanalinema rosaneae TaxID=1620701 RepID=UPI003D6EF509